MNSLEYKKNPDKITKQISFTNKNFQWFFLNFVLKRNSKNYFYY